MTKTLTLIFLLLLVVGCVDNSQAIKLCEEYDLQWTGDLLGDIECVNITSGEKKIFESGYKITRK